MVAAGIKTGPPDQLLIYMQKRAGGNCPKTIPACSFLYFLYIMMLGSKGILTLLIPDCYVLCTLVILKNIRNPLIFLWKWLLTHVFGGTLSSDVYGYDTTVTYWMPFVYGQGLHDASWQTSFGGDTYKTKGSHGCINLPPDQAKIIYETIDKGYPILLYWCVVTELYDTRVKRSESWCKLACKRIFDLLTRQKHE